MILKFCAVWYNEHMASGGQKQKWNFSRWLDEWKIAWSGAALATRSRQFLLAFALSFVFFGTLMNLLSGSNAALNLFWVSDLPGKMDIIWRAFLATFGVGRNFWDWLPTFVVVVLQSTLIGLVVFVWRKRRRSHKEQILATAANSENVQSAGLAAGLAILGSGCPTCGTTLLAPVISAMFSTGGLALASFVSSALTLAAVLITFFAIKRVGADAYALVVSERFQKLHPKLDKEQVS